MLENSECSTSNAAKFNVESTDVEIEDFQDYDCSSLWCIEDDTLFYAQGLKHHSGGKGKSVYVTWNENYVLNFVFKTSTKIGTTTLTKVKISLPVHDQEMEEISNILILEMNTIIYMKSGRVYYFSSVKSMHKVDWLKGVRCMNSCPLTRFSVIRVEDSFDHGEQYPKKVLILEVYKDVPHLGKSLSNDVLTHRYNISFDFENLFNCDWLNETYNLTSLITDENNIAFLKQLVSIGNVFHSHQEVANLSVNQEIHLLTISGNIFVLVGAIMPGIESTSSNMQVEDFSINLLNTYACSIECIRIDCENNLLIVLLQSGHMDIWYKSKQMFGALLHCQHNIINFLYYDFWQAKNVFFFTTPEDVIKLEIIISKGVGATKECIVKETRKNVGGMIACTFVESLQQLICVSINNIFYRINFIIHPEDLVEITNENITKYENLNNVYALNDKRITDLAAKAQIVDNLIKQPKYLHNAVEKEFQKQQILALESKSDILKKLFHCSIEYHAHLPGINYFDDDYVHIKTSNYESQQLDIQSVFCLIFMSLKSNENNFHSSAFTATNWYLHISNIDQCSQLYIPYKTLKKKLCFIIQIPMRDHIKKCLPKFSLNLLSFYNHQYQSICLQYHLDIQTNERTYLNLFSYNILKWQIYGNSFDNITNLLGARPIITNNSISKCNEIAYKLKQRFKVQRSIFKEVIEKLVTKSSWSTGLDIKIYYLHQYLIELNYDDSEEILLISSNYPVAIFYIKLILVKAMQSYNNVAIIETSVYNMQQLIMNYQNEIEHVYGSLISLDSDGVSSNRFSLHLENLRNVYLKLRIDLYDIFR